MSNISELIEQYEAWKAEQQYRAEPDPEAFQRHLEDEWALRRADAIQEYIRGVETVHTADLLSILNASYGDKYVKDLTPYWEGSRAIEGSL